VPATPTPPPSASPTAPGATATAPPGLPFTNVVLTEPLDGAVVADGAVTVSGTTDATRITISALYLGPPAAPAPGPTGSPDPLTTPTTATITPVPLPTASTTPPAAPAPVDAAIVVGAFTQVVDLEPGSWEITVTASATDHTTTETKRTVEVPVLADGVTVLVEIRGGDAWMVGYEDGRRKRGAPGRIYHDGESLLLFGLEKVSINTGVGANTFYTVNGESLGSLGAGGVETWTFEKGQPPRTGY
ncbi:MAG: hypothetical protein ABIZ34_02210, partial [Candidatus Limnocylindrales bacterium]